MRSLVTNSRVLSLFVEHRELVFVLFVFAGFYKAAPIIRFFPVDITILFAGLSGLICLLLSLQGRIRFDLALPLVSLIFFAMAFGFPELQTFQDYGFQKYVRFYTLTLFAVAVGFIALQEGGSRAKYLKWMAVLGLLMSAAAILQTLGTTGKFHRMTTFGTSPIHLGRLSGFAILWGLFLFSEGKLSFRYLVLGFPILVPALIGSGTRGPMLALSLTAAFIFAYRLKSFLNIKLLVLAAATFAGALLFIGMRPKLLRRFAFLWGEGDQTSDTRLEAWGNALELIRAMPLGSGFGGFLEHYQIYHKGIFLLQYPHNIFLEIAAESGVIALAVFCLVVVTALVFSYRRGSRANAGDTPGFESRACFLSLFYWLVNASVSGDVDGNRAFWVALVIALCGLRWRGLRSGVAVWRQKLSSYDGISPDFLLNLASNAAGPAIVFLSLPVLARLYSPEDFGRWATFMALAVVVPILAGLRYELAVVVARSNEAARQLMVVILLLSLVISLLVTGLAAFVSAAELYDERRLFPLDWVWLLPVMLLAVSITQSNTHWWIRQKSFGRIALIRVTTALATVASQMVLAGSAGVAPDGLVLGVLIGYAVGAAVASAAALFSGLPPYPRRFRKRLAVAAAARYRRMPLFTTPYAVQHHAGHHAVPFILGALGYTAVAGFYGLAFRIVRNPLTLVSHSLSQVFLAQMARTEDPLAWERSVTRTLTALTLMALPLFPVFWFNAETIVRWGLGQTWLAAVPVLSAVLLMAVTTMATNWLVRTFEIKDRQKLHFSLDFGLNCIVIGGFAVTLWVTRDPLEGVIVFCLLRTVQQLIWTMVVFSIAEIPMHHLFRTGGYAILVCGAWGAVSYLSAMLPHLPNLMIISTSLVLYYAVLAKKRIWLVHRESSALQA